MKKITRIAIAILTGTALLAIAAPRAARAYRSMKAERRQARITQAWASVKAGQDYLSFTADELEDDLTPENSRLPERDDPMLRMLVNAAEFGYATPAFTMQKARVTAQESRRWAHLLPRYSVNSNGVERSVAAASLAQLPKWYSIGPTDVAKPEYNGDEYVANDTGRAAAIRVHPSNPDLVYFATNNGGLWRTTNFTATTPTWTPLTDTMGDMAIGGMDVVFGSSDTIWLGIGDINEGSPGGFLFFSTDSGATWSAPIQLLGNYPSDPQAKTVATRIRDVRVDPNNPAIVMAATDVGLFRSTNANSGSPTFALMDLPNPGTQLVKESLWSFAYLGATAGGPSNWLVAGVPATTSGTAYLNLPPSAGGGTSGNPGDIWKSTDAGATWTSSRKALLLAGIISGLTVGQELGRMMLAAGTPVAGDPTQTAVYVQAGNASEGTSLQAGTFKTVNSGTSFTFIAKDTSTLVTNPTIGISDCSNMNIAHAQAWYNLAIAVDPNNNNNVIQGGNLCAVRSINGGTSWQAVAHWLPLPRFATLGFDQGNTDVARTVYLPYVHADWHAIYIANGTVYAGTDGGIFASGNVFTTDTVDPANMPITWRQVNTGLVTHLPYALGSGDPVTGNQRYAFIGLQDNGTRMRDSGSSTKWNQVVGGDGVASAISIWGDGSHQVFFHSLPGRRQYCRPGESFFIAGSFDPAISRDCNSGLLHPNQGPDNLNTEWTTWTRAINSNLPSGDSEPFLLRIIPVNDGKGSMFTNSTQYAWKMTIDDNDLVNYQLVSPIFQAPRGLAGNAVRSTRGMVQATPWTYTFNLPPGAPGPTGLTKSRLYGTPMSGGFYFIGVENSFSVSSNVQQSWNWNSSQSPLGTGTAQGATISFTSAIDFPHDPTHLGGAAPTSPSCGIPAASGCTTDLFSTYIVSTTAPVDNANQLIKDDVGRIFKTNNNGVSWAPIATVASGMPNVPVYIVRFDPNDPTDQTIYAGTDIGLYRTTDGGTTWARFGYGLPTVRVSDIFIAQNGSLIRVATYGRGVWEIYPHAQAGPAAGNGDWDANGQIDFLDLGALASRMGKAPADDPEPHYDYKVDLSDSASTTLDDADLTALLAKYGSAP